MLAKSDMHSSPDIFCPSPNTHNLLYSLFRFLIFKFLSFLFVPPSVRPSVSNSKFSFLLFGDPQELTQIVRPSSSTFLFCLTGEPLTEWVTLFSYSCWYNLLLCSFSWREGESEKWIKQKSQKRGELSYLEYSQSLGESKFRPTPVSSPSYTPRNKWTFKLFSFPYHRDFLRENCSEFVLGPAVRNWPTGRYRCQSPRGWPSLHAAEAARRRAGFRARPSPSRPSSSVLPSRLYKEIWFELIYPHFGSCLRFKTKACCVVSAERNILHLKNVCKYTRRHFVSSKKCLKVKKNQHLVN